jgi:uncharacterized membrane protein YkgB
MDRYRLGIVAGSTFTVGAYSLLSALEVILFGGTLISWTRSLAALALVLGVAIVCLSFLFHFWVKSLFTAVTE